MKILVTGKNGQLGQSIKRLLDENVLLILAPSVSFLLAEKS